jgi:hypothetical protein
MRPGVAASARRGYSDGAMHTVAPRQAGPVMARMWLTFVVGLLVLHAGQLTHLHKGTTAGAYNEEHVLASLESATGDVPLPAPAPSLVIARALERTVPVAFSPVPSLSARQQDSRAPPLA